MNNLLPAGDELHYVANADDFNQAFKAIQAAEWVVEPTDPTCTGGGLIQIGETVWLHRDHFGSGPNWTQVRFADKTLGYVHLADFTRFDGITSTSGEAS